MGVKRIGVVGSGIMGAGVAEVAARSGFEVVLRSRIPSGAAVKATEPKATPEGDILVWNLGNLDPRQEKRIDLHLVPSARGSLPCHAFVTFTGSSTARRVCSLTMAKTYGGSRLIR